MGNEIFRFPERKMMLVILAIVLLYPLHYILLTFFHEPGYVFNGYCGDDCILLNIMKSWEWGTNLPWLTDRDVGIMSVIGIGPLYLLLPLGYAALSAGMDAAVLFEIFKAGSSLLLFIGAYSLFLGISEKAGRKMFLIFLLTAGLGGIFYMIIGATEPAFFLAPDVLWGIGFNPMRMLGGYYPFPMALGIISVLLAVKGRHTKSSVLGGVTSLVYPIYGIAFASVNIILFWMKKDRLSALRMALVNAVFLVPWAYVYWSNFFSYSKFSGFVESGGGIVMPTFIMSFGIPIALISYHSYRKSGTGKIITPKKLAFITAFLAFIALYSLSSVSQSPWYTGEDIVRENIWIFLMKIPLFALATAGFIIYSAKSRDGFHEKFISIWLLMFLAIVLVPSEIFPFSVRLQAFLWIPFSALAGIAVSNFRKPAAIMAILVLISLPSHAVYNLYIQNNARDYSDNSIFYSTDEEREALSFLETQKDGGVLAAPGSSMLVPLFSGKRSMIAAENYGFTTDWEDHVSDFRLFFSSASPGLAREILKKYKISYVYAGPREGAYGDVARLDGSVISKIYENGEISIYSVIE